MGGNDIVGEESEKCKCNTLVVARVLASLVFREPMLSLINDFAMHFCLQIIILWIICLKSFVMLFFWQYQ